MLGWRRVVTAADCRACPDCGAPVCGHCAVHYADCACPGPTQDERYQYHFDALGTMWARPHPHGETDDQE